MSLRFRLLGTSAAIVGALIVGALLLAQLYLPAPAAVTTPPPPTPGSPQPPAAATSATPVPTAAATPSALPPGTYEDPILGYRITLPQGYRLARASIVTGQREALGGASFTSVTEREERETCLRDVGHVGFPGRDPIITVGVSRNVAGISAREWATTPRSPGAQPLSMHRTVESPTISGHEAVRLVWEQTGESAAFVIRANDRMYVFYPESDSMPSRMPKGWLDDIAKTFTVIRPAPFPAPTATVAPELATRELALAMAKAFAARDADAVARVITPRCWLGVGSTVPSGGHGRAVALFINELRAQFGSAAFGVSVDPQVQLDTRAERYFVRSTWKESGRTTQIDLLFGESDGRWYWTEARHHHEGGASYSCLWAGTVTQC